MLKSRLALVALVGLGVGAMPLSAQVATGALPTNAYISFGGFEWAWAYPLESTTPGFSGMFTLSGQSGFGWRLPTAAELALAPVASNFLFSGGNVPFGGSDAGSGANFQSTNAAYTGDGACATPWFSTVFVHCDWGNGPGVGGALERPWAGQPGADGFAEQLVVRDVTPNGTVPEPATMSLMALGLSGLAAARRRRNAKK